LIELKIQLTEQKDRLTVQKVEINDRVGSIRVIPPDAQAGDQAFLVRVGDTVRLERQRRKLTQDQLCDRAGIRRMTLIDLEKARRAANVLTLLHIAQALDMDLRDLLP
jgi:DNA-binding XRE family transcriptional regulator